MNTVVTATGALALAYAAFGPSTSFGGAASERQPRPLVEAIPVATLGDSVRNTGSKKYSTAFEELSASRDLNVDGDMSGRIRITGVLR